MQNLLSGRIDKQVEIESGSNSNHMKTIRWAQNPRIDNQVLFELPEIS